MKKKIFITIAFFLSTGVLLIVTGEKINLLNRFSTNDTTRLVTVVKEEKKYVTNSKISNGIYKASIELANSNTWIYDPAYYTIRYPNGDVPSGGACTDVVIRVLRKNNMDLQQLIHEDMSKHFSEYPQKWGLKKTDPNIDHRRVANIMKYFERKGYGLRISSVADDYQPGDIVTWELSPGITHIGIVLENQDVFHNMGPTSKIESGFLFSHKIIGHYRL